MGMSASQMRYLSLTARKSDLEFQSQTINQERLNLANRSSDINRAYTEGMSNQVIRIANGYEKGTGLKTWTELTYNNAQEMGYQIIGGGGEILVPSPYEEFEQNTVLSVAQYNALPASAKLNCKEEAYTLSSDADIVVPANTTVSETVYQALSSEYKQMFTEIFDESTGVKTYKLNNPITFAKDAVISTSEYNLLAGQSLVNTSNCTEKNPHVYRTKTYVRGNVKDDYKGIDIQSLLVSGRGQIVSNEFFSFLCAHGYGSGKYYTEEKVNGQIARNEVSYEDLVELFQNQNLGTKTVIDWRADESNIFKQANYTEDDALVLAKYEAQTAEIQQKDKMLEVQLKRIETEHKAIETEMDAIKKVIDKNIENSYKTFG